MVMPLEKRCVNFLVKNLQPSNVFNLLDQCLKWEVSKELLDKCKQYIQKQTNEVLQSETFQGISFEHLIILLEQDTLSVTEGELLKSVRFSFHLHLISNLVMSYMPRIFFHAHPAHDY